MATATDESERVPFYNDPKIRGLIWQALLAIVVVWLVWTAASNAITNLRAAKIASGFGFWNVTSGFDIGQRLIDYSAATGTYGRAFWVGLLNTLLVAAIGVVLATILGFLLGVARLSRNFMVGKLAAVYVEVVRNTPLVLQLFIWYHAVLKPLPGPRQSIQIPLLTTGPLSDWYAGLVGALMVAAGFLASRFTRGSRRSLDVFAAVASLAVVGWVGVSLVLHAFPLPIDAMAQAIVPVVAAVVVGWFGLRLVSDEASAGTAAFLVGIASGLTVLVGAFFLAIRSGLLAPSGTIFFLNNRGLYLPEWTFGPTMTPVWWVLLGGIAITLLFRFWARREQMRTGRQYPVGLVALLAVVVVPAIVFLIQGRPVTFAYPVLQGFNLRGGIQVFPEFVALLAGLTFYTAAFIGENVRAGILAVNKGQTEAAHSLGLRPGPTLRLVVIPQAMRVIIPPLTSQYLNLTKNSSLAVFVGYPDLVQVFMGTVLNQTGQAIEVIAITMLVYLTISLTTSLFMNWYNARKALVER